MWFCTADLQKPYLFQEHRMANALVCNVKSDKLKTGLCLSLLKRDNVQSILK